MTYVNDDAKCMGYKVRNVRCNYEMIKNMLNYMLYKEVLILRI